MSDLRLKNKCTSPPVIHIAKWTSTWMSTRLQIAKNHNTRQLVIQVDVYIPSSSQKLTPQGKWTSTCAQL